MRSSFNRFSRRLPSPAVSREESSAFPEIDTLYERCEELKSDTSDLVTRFKKEWRAAQTYEQECKKIDESLMTFYDRTAQRRGDATFVAAFEKTRDFQLNYTSWFTSFANAMNQSVTTNLQQKTAELFATGKASRKNYLKAKNTYEAALAKKGKDVEQEIEAAKNAYLTAGDEAIATLKDTLQEVEMQILDWMCSYWDVHAEYHLTAAKWVNNIRPQFESHRSYVRDTLAKHYVKKAARKPRLHASSPAASTKLFGCPLTEFMERDGTLLPPVITEMIEYLLKEAPTMEGVFRLSAMKSTLVNAQQQLDRGEPFPLEDVPDTNLVPALFKQFLRDLPQPLLTWELYPDFLKVNTMDDEEAQREALRGLIHKLPPASRLLCKRLMELLSRVVEQEEVTKMGLGNLSTVMGPNILSTKEINPATMIEEMENANGVVAILISQWKEIFPPTSPLMAAQDDDLPALQAFVEDGASCDATDAQGRTLLHWACIHHDLAMVEFLLQLDPLPFSLNATDEEGRTPLMYASSNRENSQAIQQVLVQAGAESTDSEQAAGDTENPSPRVPPARSAPALRVSSDELTSPETTPRRKKSHRKKKATSASYKKETLKVRDGGVTRSGPTSPQTPIKSLPKPISPIRSPALSGAELEEELDKALALADLPEDNLDDATDSTSVCITSLSSLLEKDVPLPSIWTAINLNELSSVAHALTKAALVPTFGPTEVGAVNAALQCCADGLKNLFSGIEKFMGHFSDGDKKDVMAHALTLRTTVRGLIQVIKSLNSQPDNTSFHEDLRSHTKQIVDCVYKFFRACEMACVDGVVSAAHACNQQSQALVELSPPASEDAQRQACQPLATSTVQLTQWVHYLCMTQYDNHVDRASFTTGVSVINQCTVGLVNQALRVWGRGQALSKDDVDTFTEKLQSELQQLESSVDRDRQETHLTLREQEEHLQDACNQATHLLQQLGEVTFASDLYKALVLQMKLIRRKMDGVCTLQALDPASLLLGAGELGESLKKIRVGISAMKKDASVGARQQLELWSESLFHVLQAIRLSMAATVLRLPVEVELQFAYQVGTMVRVCEEFYQYLSSLAAPSS